MNSIDEQHAVALQDGSEIRICEEPLSFSRFRDGKCESMLKLSFPSAGYAGGSIYLSPSEQYILHAFYSGQSEEAFSIYRIGESLSPVFESGYRYGECASYCFSSEENRVVQALPYLCCEWSAPWTEGDAEEDEQGRFFQFGELNILHLDDQRLEEHNIIVRPSADWRPKDKEYEPFLSPRFIGQDMLSVAWPWGREEMTLPIEGDLVIRPGRD